MNQNIFFKIITFSLLIFGSNGCFNDLNTTPIDKDIITADAVYDDPASYLGVLAKLYAGLAVTGQEGPSGQSDIQGIDEGFGQYTRGYFHHQELTTDEAVVGWNDQTIKDFHDQDWSAEDGFIFAFYSRVFYQIPLCNEYLRETTNEKLDGRGVDDALRNDVQGYRAEARFLRALSYWHALDIFRNVPFVTEDDKVGAFFPNRITAADLFNYIETELLAIENEIATARSNDYGRADQGAVWILLAKLYLNAEVYIGTSKYTECLNYCTKILNAGYTLEPKYQDLFLADNDNSTEIIFPVTFDGINTRTWGGTTFIIRAAIGGEMNPSESGVSGGWAGLRTTRQFVEKFPGDIGGLIVAPSEGQTAQYPKIYVPGEYQGWDASNTETSLSSVNSDNFFEGYKYFSEDNSKFLITKFPSFSLTYGDNGGDGTLEINGDTIVAGQAGMYSLKVNMSDLTYDLERTTWSINGDATGGQDMEMTWDAELEAMSISANLTAGTFKFRANNNWAVNLGDTDADAILTQDGDEITIPENSNYKILLFLDKPDYTYQINNTSFDSRSLFFTEGQSIDIDDITQFNEGYAVQKFKNVNSDGTPGSNTDFPDTDFPMFRLADVYLMAAEAIVRSNGNMELATNYFNEVRQRAYNGTGGNIESSELNLDLLIDERGRELYWECHRRTDLVRFGKFSQTDYLWAWKGGVKDGISVEAYRDVFPIPSADLTANPNLKQNEGY
jgi:SusD family